MYFSHEHKNFMIASKIVLVEILKDGKKNNEINGPRVVSKNRYKYDPKIKWNNGT